MLDDGEDDGSGGCFVPVLIRKALRGRIVAFDSPMAFLSPSTFFGSWNCQLPVHSDSQLLRQMLRSLQTKSEKAELELKLSNFPVPFVTLLQWFAGPLSVRETMTGGGSEPPTVLIKDFASVVVIMLLHLQRMIGFHFQVPKSIKLANVIFFSLSTVWLT